MAKALALNAENRNSPADESLDPPPMGCTVSGMKNYESDPRRRALDSGLPDLTVEAVAIGLGVSKGAVYGWIKQGRLRAVRIGPKFFRIRQTDLEEFLREGGMR